MTSGSSFLRSCTEAGPALRTRLRPTLADEPRRARAQNLPNRHPGHAQISADPPDRTVVTIMGPPNLPSLVRSKHPRLALPNQRKSGCMHHRKRVSLECRSCPQMGRSCMPIYRQKIPHLGEATQFSVKLSQPKASASNAVVGSEATTS